MNLNTPSKHSEYGKLSKEEQLLFQVNFFCGYILSILEREIDTFGKYTKPILKSSVIGYLILPGGTLFLSLPITVISWKHRKKIQDIINKKHIQFFH